MNNKIIILIFLTIIFIFSITSLYYEVMNINNLKFPEFRIVKFNYTTTMKNNTPYFYEDRSNDNTYLFVLIVITTIVGLILYFERDNIKVAILKMSLLLGFFYSLFFISNFLSFPSEREPINKPTFYVFEISIIITYVMLAVLIIITAVFISSLGIKLNYQQVKKSKIDMGIKARKELEEIITDITEKYSKKIYGLRELITECYKSMCEFLEKYGVDNPKYLTAREFEEHVYNLIRFRSKNLSNLTKLFEKAKYSNEELREEDYSLALKLLNNIKEELRK